MIDRTRLRTRDINQYDKEKLGIDAHVRELGRAIWIMVTIETARTGNESHVDMMEGIKFTGARHEK